jgi:hypothetical protein
MTESAFLDGRAPPGAVPRGRVTRVALRANMAMSRRCASPMAANIAAARGRL